MPKQPDPRNLVQEARRQAMARAALAETETPDLPLVELDEAECFTSLVIAMYASGLKLGMGVMPDGMAIFIRLSMPTDSTDPHAGHVSFVISDDTAGVLRKAVQALEAPVKPPWWKPDQFARKAVT